MSGISDRDRDVLLNEIDQIRKALQKTGTSTFADSSSESDEDQAAPIAQGLRDHEKSWRESTLKSWGTTSSNLEDVEDSSEEETSDDNEESSSYYPASRSYVSSSDRWQSYGIDLESSHGENEGNVMLSHAENILSRSNQSSVLTSVPSGIASLRTGAETPLSFPTTPQTPTSFMIDTDDEAYLSESTRSRSVSRAGNSSVSGVGLTPQVAASNLYVEKIFKTQRRKLSGSGQVSLLPGSSSAGSGNPSLGTLECALQLNKQYQEVLRDELKKVERALIKNKEKQEALSSEGQSKTNKVSAFMISHAKFAPTYFKDAFGMGPPDNEDTKERRARTRIEPYETRTKLWTEEERNKLADGVRNQNLEKRLGVWMKKLKNLEKDARYGRKKISEKERRDILQKIEEVRFGLEILVNITDDDRRQESNEIKKMLVHVPETKISKEELEKDVDDLDFFKISKLYLPKRTEFECRLQWLNLDHPRINHAKWTKEEDNQLIKLAEEFQSRHWNKIAEKLGFDNTLPFLPREWTREDDAQLIAAIKMYGTGNWQIIAAQVDGRTGQQCIHRWWQSLRPNVKKGRFTSKEDKLLIAAVRKYGYGRWRKIADEVPGRTDAQCRERLTKTRYLRILDVKKIQQERYTNTLDPTISFEPFSIEEDTKLLELVDTYGLGKWSFIARNMPGRTDSQIARRWQSLRSEDHKRYRKNVLGKRNSVLTYFVGRNHERPEYDLQELDVPITATVYREHRSKNEVDYSLCDVGFEAAPPRTSVRSPVQVKESWTQTKLTALGKPHRLTPALHTVKKRNRISYGGKKSGDDDLKQEDEIEEENEIGSQMKAEGMDVGNEFDAGSQGEHITTKSKKSRVKVEGNSEDEDEEWSPAKLRRHRSRSQKQELDSTTEASDAEDFYAEDHLFPRTPSRRAAKVKAEKLISSVGNNDNESDVEEVHIISDIEGSDHGDHHEDDDGVDDEKIKSEENCKVDVKSEWDTESSVNKDLMEKIKQEPSDLDPILKSGQVAIDSFERGSISYADAKLELYRVKMEILNHKFDPEKSYLLSLNLAQVQRIEEIKQSWRRTCKDNGHKGTKGNEAEESESPRKQKRKLDKPRKVAKPRLLSEEANQDDHIGLPVSPTAVSPGQRIQDMPGVLGPFTLLLQALRINISGVMGAIQGQQQSASQSANQQPKAQTNSNIFTSSSSFLDEGRPVIVPRVPPLLPNRVTLASFRKLLLHRRKLEKQCTEWKQALSNNQNGVETRSPVKVEDQSTGREGSSGFGPSVNTEINPRKSSKSLKITSAVSSRDYHDTFEYKMLSARFNSLFVWPAFLATFSARRPRKNRTKEELMKSLSCADVDLKEDYPESKHTNKKNRKVRNLRKKKIESVGDVSAKKIKHKKKGSVANESFPSKRRKVSRKCDEFEEITRHKSARKESVAAKVRLTTKRNNRKSKTARKRNCRDPTYEPPVNIKTEIKEEVDN